MGTPFFAVPSLDLLVKSGCNIVGVITAPDRPKGRGKKVTKSAVKDYAESIGLKILQPTNLKDEGFLRELRVLKADLQIVVAFRMLPKVVWSMPSLGTFNLHASLLPQFRGAAPINWAIINGAHETGITTFFLKHKIDTGNIVFQEKEPIHDDDDAGSLHDRLMIKGSKLVLRTLKAIENGNYRVKTQEEPENPISAPKLTRANCEIKWDNPSTDIINHIRGLSPYPGAWTTYKGKTLKIYAAAITDLPMKNPGILSVEDGKIIAGTSDQTLSLQEVQLEGKKRMKTQDLLRGLKVK